MSEEQSKEEKTKEAINKLWGTEEFNSIFGMLANIFPRVAETRTLTENNKYWTVKKPFDTYENLTEDGKLVYDDLYEKSKAKEGKK